ncbi:MAG: hypothetical protein ACFFDS_03180 [Candidatus Thorarchaeota archaeon]
MIKKRHLSPLFVLIILLNVTLFSLSFDSKNIQQTTLPKLNPAYRPVFQYADENATELFPRNDTAYWGAVIEADVYDNVSIWYSYYYGDNESLVRLHGDDGYPSNDVLSWLETEPTFMTYDNETTVNEGAGVLAYYNYTFNLSSEFILFRAKLGEYEDDIGVPNMITTGVRTRTWLKQEFYTQYDAIDADISLFNYNITSYGLMYRDITEGFSKTFKNVTVALTQNGTSDVVSASITHSYDPGTKLDIRSFMVHFDNITKEYRVLIENQAHIITLVDGDPELEVNSRKYTNSLNVSVSWNAELIKANFTSIDIDWDDITGIETYIPPTVSNISHYTLYHLYSSPGGYNISVTANAFSASSTKTVEVIIDQASPTGDILIKMTNGTFVEPDPLNPIVLSDSSKQATFLVSGVDVGGSGIDEISVESDEGNKAGRVDDGELTLSFLEYRVYSIDFKITDNAGNEYSITIFIELIEPDEPNWIPVPFPFGLVTILGLVSLALIYLKKRR